MKVLVAVIDSARPQDLLGFCKAKYDSAQVKGRLAPIGEGHTVTTALAMMTGRIPYYKGKLVGDWIASEENGGTTVLDLSMFGDNLIGKSGKRELWFNMPLLHPIPRIKGVVVVGGVPFGGFEPFTQPPWLEAELSKMGYIVDVTDIMDTDMLVRMETVRGLALQRVLTEFEWDFAVTWFTGFDRLHHSKQHLVNPNDTPENRRKVMEAIDKAVHAAYQAADPDVLFLMSDHGWSDARHSHAPNGFYAISGRGVSLQQPSVASVMDVIPTVYKLLGVEPPSDILGRPLMDRKDPFIIWNEKVRHSFELVSRYASQNAAVAFSGGKDSTVAWFLAHKANPDIQAIFVDTWAHFNETYYTLLQLEEEGMKYYIAKQPRPLVDMAVDRAECCRWHKILPQQKAIEEFGVKYLITGIRRDDGGGRESEQEVVKRVTATGYEYYQVNPLLDWTEQEVFDFLLANGVPINALYYRGYRSIDCVPCTARPVSDVIGSEGERSGRVKQNILVRLRTMGYY